MHYVKRNFLAGREPQPIDEANRALRGWLEQTAGRRIHGTTKQVPLERFRQVEAAALLPLPATEYDPAVWKEAKVYRDGYVTFEQAYYSAPCRLVGQSVWVRGGARTVEVYTADHELVTTHDRATLPGERKTHPDHLPPEKLPGLILTRESCRLHAAAIGSATAALVEALLDHRPEDRLRSAGRVVGLAKTYGADRLERACTRARHFGDGSYPTVKRILTEGLDADPLPIWSSQATAAAHPAVPAPRSYAFVRQAGELVAALVGAVR